MVITGAAVFAIPLLVSTANGVLSLVSFFQKKPPLHEKYATKEELHSLRGELGVVQERFTKNVKSLTDDLNRRAVERERQLAQAEERLEKSIGAMSERVERRLTEGQETFNGIQKEMASMSTRVGELKGALDAHLKQ